MDRSRVLALYAAAVVGAAVGAFFATPYPEVLEQDDNGIGMTGCCPWGSEMPSQPGLLHLPRVMRHGESYLLVLVTGRKTGIDTLRLIGDSLLGESGSWDTVRVPLADRLEIRASGQLFQITPVRPEERRWLLRSHSPELWVWEVYPLSRGRLLLFIGGSAWVDSMPFYFDLAHARVEVEGSWWTRLIAFSETTIAKWIGTAIVLPAVGWIFNRWAVEPWRRRRRRAAGFGR